MLSKETVSALNAEFFKLERKKQKMEEEYENLGREKDLIIKRFFEKDRELKDMYEVINNIWSMLKNEGIAIDNTISMTELEVRCIPE